MAEKTTQQYIEEMMRMYKSSAKSRTDYIPAAAEVMPSESNYSDGEGGLAVNVTTLRSLYPVKGATVTVFTGSNDNRTIIVTDITDESGKTGVFKLETPPKQASQTADSGQIPYTNYNISITADGYIDNIRMNVPVFSGVVSVQAVDLTPIAAAGKNTAPQMFDENSNYEL